MIHRTQTCILLLLFLNSSLFAQLSLTYTGNMGVLLSNDSHTIIIDGLHQFYGPAYQHPSAPMIEDLMTDGNDYPIPDVALVTHFHRDHFSAKLLHKLSGNIVIGPQQVTDSLSMRDQDFLRTVPYTEFELHPYQFEDLAINAFRMDHVNRHRHQQVQNIGYLIDLGGYSVLHVGDTDWYETMFEKLALIPPIDIAILPVWMVLQEKSHEMIQRYFNPKQLVVTHVDPRNANATRKQIRRSFPDAKVLTQLGETHSF